MAVCLVGVGDCIWPKVGWAQTRDVIRRSDVAFAYEASPAVYRRYGATLVAWGFRPWRLSGEPLIAEWKRRVDEVHRVGARYQARVELDAGWKGWIDFADDPTVGACRSLEGKVLTYKFWTTTYKGHPAYQGCTNAPPYREYLYHQAREALSAHPDMLLIDAIQVTPMTIWQGGCFCQWCLAGFRKHLRQHVPAEVLKSAGVEDVSTFDYGAFLRERGVTDSTLARELTWWPPRVPLAEQWLTFQHLAARDFIADFRGRVEETEGRRVPMSTSSILLRPRDWWAYPVVDFFTIEAPYRADTQRPPRESVFRFKLADALGKRLLVTAMPSWDWAYVRDQKRSGLVRTWIAQAYAYGHLFMVPHSMWCGENEKARYESKPGDCDDLYRFVREHDDLFDGYHPLAPVGLLYSNTAFRRHQAQAREVCYELTRQNIPFRIIVAGDDWLPKQLTKKDLGGLKALIVTEPTFLDEEQQRVLDAARDDTVQWPDSERLFELLRRQILVEGAENVTVLPRVNSEDETAPGICHLLNENYDSDKDEMVPTGEFKVHLANSLYARKIKSVTLLSPGQPEVRCAVQAEADGVSINVPSLELWAMLRLGWN